MLPDQSTEARVKLKRRGLIAGTAALSAALLAKMSAREAHAADGGNLILGQNNTSSEETRISRSGASVVNAFTVTGSSTSGAAAISGQGAGSTVGVVGTSQNQIGVVGISTTNVAIQGASTDYIAIFGQSGPTVGVYGQSTGGAGVLGNSVNSFGVIGTSAPGVGVFGQSVNNLGVQGSSQNAAGVQGSSSNAAGVVGFSSGFIGVHGISTSGAAGRFDGEVVVNGNFSASGMKSAVVVASDGVQRRLYCMESPESWFEDFGEGEIRDGAGTVKIDPEFASVVDLGRTYYVFLTPLGDCQGLGVAERSQDGFVVRELRGGVSSIRFSYRVVAYRRDVQGRRLQRENIPQTVPGSRRDAAPARVDIPEPPRAPSVIRSR